MLRLIALAAGYLMAVYGGGFFVEAALERILRPSEQETIRAFRRKGLANGAITIGRLERFLVLTFLLLGSLTAVGVPLRLLYV